MRRAASTPLPPSFTERQILGVSGPSKRGPGALTAALSGGARAASPAASINFLRETLPVIVQYPLVRLIELFFRALDPRQDGRIFSRIFREPDAAAMRQDLRCGNAFAFRAGCRLSQDQTVLGIRRVDNVLHGGPCSIK